MIRLTRSVPPKQLTSEVVLSLTKEFAQDDQKRVWNKPYIKASLLKMSNGKCCYCECKIDEESKYLEIEHFLPKKLYKDQVVEWNNLLPSCKRCNGVKGSHDTKLEPIIDPTITEPKEHLSLINYRFYARSKLGQATIKVVDLNDNTRKSLTRKRFVVGNAIAEELENMMELLTEHPTQLSPGLMRMFQGKIKAFLISSSKHSEYSATAATILFNDKNYPQIKEIMKKLGIWQEEYDSLEAAGAKNALSTQL